MLFQSATPPAGSRTSSPPEVASRGVCTVMISGFPFERAIEVAVASELPNWTTDPGQNPWPQISSVLPSSSRSGSHHRSARPELLDRGVRSVHVQRDRSRDAWRLACVHLELERLVIVESVGICRDHQRREGFRQGLEARREHGLVENRRHPLHLWRNADRQRHRALRRRRVADRHAQEDSHIDAPARKQIILIPVRVLPWDLYDWSRAGARCCCVPYAEHQCRLNGNARANGYGGWPD